MKKTTFLLLICTYTNVFAQETDSTTIDAYDIAKKILWGKKVNQNKEKLGSLIPFINFNPSVGIRAGVVFTGGKYYGNRTNTTLSIWSAGASVSTKGTNSVVFRHNIFTNKNAVNFLGDWQLSANMISDYGLGSNTLPNNTIGSIIDGTQLNNTPIAFPLNFNYFKLHERVYAKVHKHIFIGGGIAIDVRWKINDEKAKNNENTPHVEYNTLQKFSSTAYNAIGFTANVQWNNREHPNQSRNGMYADIIIRNNATWLGSSNNALQINTDVRKYVPLSSTQKNLVLAFWHLGGFLVTGNLPYLELPNTSFDQFSRSGRGFTFGQFRGPQYMYFESELRFPILKNNLISGVAFANTQTASIHKQQPLAQNWQYAIGTGLRFLLTKATRTNICFDAALGGNKLGFFFSINEAF